MEGVLIRSKTRWIEEGEKPSRYFLNMEKRKMINKTISSVVRDDNTYARSSCEILNESRLFYKKLYSKAENLNNSNLSCVFNGVPVLSDKLRESLEGPLSYHELLNALKGSKNDKSPGSDGFSFEFYKFFFSDIAWYLLRSLNYAYSSGSLSVTQQYGIVTMLPKGDKPRQFLKNWRPISLLNSSYKLASSCISDRLKKALPFIIHEEQKGFLSGRYIGENIRLMYDLLNFTENNNIPGMFL